MPEFCTCGAQLPPDARFCHKCAKPQRDEPLFDQERSVEEELAPPPLPVAPAAPPAILPISFRNVMAVRSAIFAGVLASLLAVVSSAFSIVALAAGGFFAVFLYRRRTGQSLTASSGAYLGWISGIFAFVVLAPLAATAWSQPQFATLLQEQMKRYPISEPEVTQMVDFMRSVPGVASILFFFFLLSTVLPAFGGALGAKVLRRH